METIAEIEQNGFSLVQAVFSLREMNDFLAICERRLLDGKASESSIRSRDGSVFAGRNLLDWFPEVRDIWRRAPLIDLLRDLLGDRFGLVRALFFDKPPERSWTLPWHKDLTIAVMSGDPESLLFAKPTKKAGVPHVEAPTELLERMLTLRLHLDDVTAENGPLKVVPGSHRFGKDLALATREPQTILAKRGDVLAIRPLVTHASGHSHPESRQHRRILHLEFADRPALADGYTWHDFVPGVRSFS